ncbi:MAG: endonuclease SmrB [Candidatus Makana argininalis]
MKKKFHILKDEIFIFKKFMFNKQDVYKNNLKKKKNIISKYIKLYKKNTIKKSIYFCFSNKFKNFKKNNGPTRYVRYDVRSCEMKKLQKGYYYPNIILDVHGMTKIQAKLELNALIKKCRNDYINCACIIHGYGKLVLKNKIPYWLSKNPYIKSFHRAPNKFGGDAALLILIDIDL